MKRSLPLTQSAAVRDKLRHPRRPSGEHRFAAERFGERGRPLFCSVIGLFDGFSSNNHTDDMVHMFPCYLVFEWLMSEGNFESCDILKSCVIFSVSILLEEDASKKETEGSCCQSWTCYTAFNRQLRYLALCW
ncbi:hypothetical protein LSAT2_011510 [Lamellibrachia satsuma]|nr:hypothetical protein LSAT2_011510 [Lamellibrachia satsuma]